MSDTGVWVCVKAAWRGWLVCGAQAAYSYVPLCSCDGTGVVFVQVCAGREHWCITVVHIQVVMVVVMRSAGECMECSYVGGGGVHGA